MQASYRAGSSQQQGGGTDIAFAEEGLIIERQVRLLTRLVDDLLDISRLKRLPGLARMRIAALTGYGQAGDRARTASAGFEAHFVKPADADSLLRFLREGTPAL